jgi:hypothetical protein
VLELQIIMEVVGRCKGLKLLLLVGLFWGENLNLEHDYCVLH